MCFTYNTMSVSGLSRRQALIFRKNMDDLCRAFEDTAHQTVTQRRQTFLGHSKNPNVWPNCVDYLGAAVDANGDEFLQFVFKPYDVAMMPEYRDAFAAPSNRPEYFVSVYVDYASRKVKGGKLRKKTKYQDSADVLLDLQRVA